MTEPISTSQMTEPMRRSLLFNAITRSRRRKQSRRLARQFALNVFRDETIRATAEKLSKKSSHPPVQMEPQVYGNNYSCW